MDDYCKRLEDVNEQLTKKIEMLEIDNNRLVSRVNFLQFRSIRIIASSYDDFNIKCGALTVGKIKVDKDENNPLPYSMTFIERQINNLESLDRCREMLEVLVSPEKKMTWVTKNDAFDQL